MHPWAESASERQLCTAAFVHGHCIFLGVGIGAVWQVRWAYGAIMSVVETHQTSILDEVGLPERSKHTIKMQECIQCRKG